MDTASTSTGQVPLEFAWRVHEYTTESIRFADAKAGAIAAWCSGFVAALFAARAHTLCRLDRLALPWGEHVSAPDTLFGGLAFGSFTFLGAGAIVALVAVLPRQPVAPPGQCTRSLIFWIEVLAQPTCSAYKEGLRRLSTGEAVEQVADHIYTLAYIATRKFKLVTLSVYLAFLGTVLSATLVLSGAL